MKVFVLQYKTPMGWQDQDIQILPKAEWEKIAPTFGRVEEYDLKLCPNCNAPCFGTMSCDKCGCSHCTSCCGTDEHDRTLCLKCARIIDTVWGKFIKEL